MLMELPFVKMKLSQINNDGSFSTLGTLNYANNQDAQGHVIGGISTGMPVVPHPIMYMLTRK